MFGNLFGIRARVRAIRDLEAQNENTPSREGEVDPAKVRALATGAALAVSLDGTPAVLVSIYDYAHRVRDRRGRSA